MNILFCKGNKRLRVRRSNFMRSKLFFSWDRIHEIKFFGSFHEIKIPNNYSISWSALFSWDQNSKIALLGNFDLMIDLLVTSTIMRSKFKINYSNLVSCTCGKFLALIISHLCLKTFNLMIVFVTNKSIMRLKFKIKHY